MTFSNIQFTTTDIPTSSDKFILSLDIPKDISTGTATVTLTVGSGKQLNAILEIIDPLLVSVKTIKNQKKRDIRRLQIKNVTINKQGTMISITLQGNNFVNRQIFFDKDGAEGREVFVKNGQIPDPHTVVTLFPASLNAVVKRRAVTQSNTILKINLELPSDVSEKINGVLVVATTEGIASTKLPISKGNKTTQFNHSGKIVLPEDLTLVPRTE